MPRCGTHCRSGLFCSEVQARSGEGPHADLPPAMLADESRRRSHATDPAAVPSAGRCLHNDAVRERRMCGGPMPPTNRALDQKKLVANGDDAGISAASPAAAAA